MTRTDGREPMIAAICSVPLLCEALSAALDGIAEVQSFPASGGDTAGLLHWLRPDGIVVDTSATADEAEPYAREARCPLVHVQLTKQQLRVLKSGRWRKVRDASPESIRNVLVAGMYRRQPA